MIQSLINSRLEVFLAIENILVMVTALVGNALMCISVVRLLRKQLPSNLFILSLVLSDLGLCIFQLPVVISSLLNQRDYVLSNDSNSSVGRILCNISGVIYFCVRQMSFFAVCFIAIDRFGALRFPLRYKTLITYKRSVVSSVTAWVLCLVIAVIPYFYWTTYVYSPVFIYCMWDIMNHPVLMKYVDFLFVPTFVISNAILAFTSVANIVKLHTLAQRGRAQKLGNTSSLVKASRTALMVVLAFTICYVPRYALVFFKVDKNTPITRFWFYYRSISEMLIYLNSAVNPLIYIFRSRQFIQEISLICGTVQVHLVENSATNGRYQSMPLANLASKTTDMLSLPRQVYDRSRSTASPLSLSSHIRNKVEEEP